MKCVLFRHDDALCGLYLSKGDYNKGLLDCERAMDIEPNSVLAHDTRARLFLLKGEYDKAIGEYGEAIKHETNDPNLLLGRSYAYRVTGAYDKALADLSARSVPHSDKRKWRRPPLAATPKSPCSGARPSTSRPHQSR